MVSGHSAVSLSVQFTNSSPRPGMLKAGSPLGMVDDSVGSLLLPASCQQRAARCQTHQLAFGFAGGKAEGL